MWPIVVTYPLITSGEWVVLAARKDENGNYHPANQRLKIHGVLVKDFHIYPRRPHPDNNYRCYRGTIGIGSGREQTRGAFSHHSEGRGRWPKSFGLVDSASADITRYRENFE